MFNIFIAIFSFALAIAFLSDTRTPISWQEIPFVILQPHFL